MLYAQPYCLSVCSRYGTISCMFYLTLTIVLNVLLFVLLKYFPQRGLDNKQVIVYNYFVCVITGAFVHNYVPDFPSVCRESWFPFALLNGLFFITMFNFIAWNTEHIGITTTSIANKLSLVIPVVFSLVLYNEPLHSLKLAGLLLAIPAIIWISQKDNVQQKNLKSVMLTILLFLGSGLLDTYVKYVEHHFLPDRRAQQAYVIWTFGTAAVCGVIFLLILKKTGNIIWKHQNVLAGIIMGIPNYFSIYYLVLLLKDPWLPSSADIPINNIGIVIVSLLVAMTIFKEKMNAVRWRGFLLAVISIILISLGEYYGG